MLRLQDVVSALSPGWFAARVYGLMICFTLFQVMRLCAVQSRISLAGSRHILVIPSSACNNLFWVMLPMQLTSVLRRMLTRQNAQLSRRSWNTTQNIDGYLSFFTTLHKRLHLASREMLKSQRSATAHCISSSPNCCDWF